MQDITGALKDVIVCEEITEATPFWAVLAIGLTGRLAADFGACVLREQAGADSPGDAMADLQRSAHAAHMRALRIFLHEGKEPSPARPDSDARSRSRTHVRLRYGSGTASQSGAGVKEIVFFGDANDDANATTSEFTIAARSGLLDIVGRSDARPLMLGGHQIAYSAGLSGFLALTALLNGTGVDRADVSALGTALWINWKSLAAAAQGRPIPRRSAESGKWRTAPCADGYVALVYFDRDWPLLARMTGDADMIALAADKTAMRENLPRLERSLEHWTRRHTRKEIAAASKAFGLAIGPVWTPAELLRDPQYCARDFFRQSQSDKVGETVRPRLPMLIAARGEGQPRPATKVRFGAKGAGPLAGVRVIDLGILTAGASTSAILADLGADVIKVESPTYLDPFRGTPGTSREEGWWNNSDAFKSTNRNKRGICLDLKSARGRELFLKLVQESDVVIENFRRGVMRRLGIGYDVLREANGGIILASVSSQGEDGPDADNISFGSTLEATSGLAAMTAYDDGVPLVTGMDLNYPDQVGSVFAASAIVAALRRTVRSGQGVHLDISQRELATFLLGEEIIAGNDCSDPSRFGNASPEYLLQDTFAAADGTWLALSIQNRAQLTAALALAASGTPDTARVDAESGKRILTQWIAQQSRDVACRLLRGCNVAAAPVLTGLEVWAFAKDGNGVIAPIARSPAGDVVKGFPLHFPQQPLAVRQDAPKLGEHTVAILQEVIGLQPIDIVRLEQEGVIGTRPASPNASRLD